MQSSIQQILFCLHFTEEMPTCDTWQVSGLELSPEWAEAGGREGFQVGGLGQTTGPQLGGVAASNTAVP